MLVTLSGEGAAEMAAHIEELQRQVADHGRQLANRDQIEATLLKELRAAYEQVDKLRAAVTDAQLSAARERTGARVRTVLRDPVSHHITHVIDEPPQPPVE